MVITIHRERHSTLSDNEVKEIRRVYKTGVTIPSLLHNVRCLRELEAPGYVMWALIDTFIVRLSDVSIVDGWWPPDAEAEVSDDKLDFFIRKAIESARDKWDKNDL